MAKKAAVKIENGVPMPERMSKSMWPLAEMKVGQSFALEGSKVQHLRMAISQWKRRHDDGKDWSTRKVNPEGTQFRCWRIA